MNYLPAVGGSVGNVSQQAEPSRASGGDRGDQYHTDITDINPLETNSTHRQDDLIDIEVTSASPVHSVHNSLPVTLPLFTIKTTLPL